jgi:hypothetical protein
MKTIVTAFVATLVATLILSGQTPAPDNAIKPEASLGKGLNDYFDSLSSSNQLSGVLFVAKNGETMASRAAGIANKETNAAIDLMNSVVSAIRERIPAK